MAFRGTFQNRRFWLGGLFLLLIAASGTLVAVYRPQGASLPPEVSRIDFEHAERALADRYGRPPSRVAVFSYLGELAASEERWPEAAACFRQIPTGTPTFGASARLQEGQIYVKLSRALDAERSLNEYLSLAARDPATPPEHLIVARNLLTYLLSIELRFEERRQVLLGIHADGQADVFDSKQLYFPNLLLWHSASGESRLEKFLEADPDSLTLQLARGRYLTNGGKIDEALTLLEGLCERNPGNLVARAALLEALFEQNSWSELETTAATLPGYEEGEPWLLTRMRGELAVHQERWQEAVEQFQRVLEVDETNPWSVVGLAAAYGGLNEIERREALLRRSAGLAKIRTSLVKVSEQDPQAAFDLAVACESLGYAEAAGTFRGHGERIRRNLSLTNPPAGRDAAGVN